MEIIQKMNIGELSPVPISTGTNFQHTSFLWSSPRSKLRSSFKIMREEIQDL